MTLAEEEIPNCGLIPTEGFSAEFWVAYDPSAEDFILIVLLEIRTSGDFDCREINILLVSSGLGETCINLFRVAMLLKGRVCSASSSPPSSLSRYPTESSSSSVIFESLSY